MSGTFPSSPAPSSVTISSNQNTIVSTTSSGRRQARQIDGQRFRLTAKFPVMSRTEFAPILAFIVKQRSQVESFQFVPPTLDDALGVASGVISVNGAINAGVTSVAIDGMANSTNGVFKAGDFFRFTGQTKVYMVMADVNSNGSGQGTLTFEPPLRSNVADNAVLIYSNVDFTVGLTGDVQEFNISTENYYQYEIDLIEVF
jgi:DNA-binding beta-propeller fold protein YncE